MSETEGAVPTGPWPLAGRRVLVTRASHQASALADRVRELGGAAIEVALIAIAPPESWEPLDEALQQLQRYRWVVLTSANGVEAVATRLASQPLAPGVRPASQPLAPGIRPASQPLAPGIRLAVVGAATARAAAALGLTVDLVPSEYRGSALPDALAPLLAAGDRILLARGDLADPALAERLRALGARVDDVCAYRTVAAAADLGAAAALATDLAAGRIDYVTLTSSSTVAGLLQRLGGPEPLQGVRIACIGPETARAAAAAGLTAHIVPPQATIRSLVAAIAHDAETHPPRRP